MIGNIQGVSLNPNQRTNDSTQAIEHGRRSYRDRGANARDVNKARGHKAKAKARGHKAKAKAKARGHKAKAKARGHKARPRPRPEVTRQGQGQGQTSQGQGQNLQALGQGVVHLLRHHLVGGGVGVLTKKLKKKQSWLSEILWGNRGYNIKN